MKLKKYILRTMLFFGGVALTTACSDEVYNEPAKEDFSKDFIKQIGLIDPNQDWNMVEQKSVTVDPGTATQVQIYAENGIVHTLVADYKNLSGKQVLTFDAAKGVNSFVVVANGEARCVGNGATVDFNRVSTRTYYPDVKDVFVQNTEYKTFTAEEVHSYTDLLPEDTINIDKVAHDDFLAVTKNGWTVTVYPVYWNAGFKHVFGIYTKDEEGKPVKTPVFVSRLSSSADADQLENISTDVEFSTDNGETWNIPQGNGVANTEGVKLEDVDYYRSKGFQVTLPKNTVYGFYLDVYNPDTRFYYDADNKLQSTNPIRHTIYTEAELNVDTKTPKEHVAFFQNRKTRCTYLAFEDYLNQPKWFDINDFFVIFDPAPLIIDKKVNEWILAAEDLGNTDDFDFNDIVVKIKHLAGESTATITALAAGATLPIYLCYDGTVLGEKEFHQWFGDYSKDKNGRYPMINTTSAGQAGETVTIDVPENYTIASFIDNIDNMGGFTIKVGDESTADVEETELTPPMNGDAPQMMVVSSDYQWPKERTSILTAYPKFGDWGANWTNQEWITAPVEGTVLTNQQ